MDEHDIYIYVYISFSKVIFWMNNLDKLREFFDLYNSDLFWR